MAKMISWRKFCSKADSAKSISSLVKILEADKVRRVSLLSEDGQLAHSPEDSLRMLLRAAFPNHVDSWGENPGKADCADESASELAKYIDVHKVKRALGSFGAMKAPGPRRSSSLCSSKPDGGDVCISLSTI